MIEGGYKVIQLLSDKGGFSDTYLVSKNDQEKVLKVLRDNSDKAIELFKREFKVLSELKHSGIPKVEEIFAYDTGNHQESNGNSEHEKQQETLFCLIMEKIPGMDLQQYLQRRGKPIDEKLALNWLKQITSTLQELHSKNLLHRDIKPSNIILQPNGSLTLIDFGAVGAIFNPKSNDRKKPNTFILTPFYASPEQERGKAVLQSDFFSLGRTFVYLLTGKELNELGVNTNDELDWHGHTTHISQKFVELIDSLMAHEVDQRPANAEAVLTRLSNIQKDSSTKDISSHSIHPTPHQREKKTMQKPLLLGGLGLMTLMFIVGGIIARFQRPTPQSLITGGIVVLPPVLPQAGCSSTGLAKKSGNLFGVIEVGSSGIKGEVIQELELPNEDGFSLVVREEEIEVRETNPQNPNTLVETVEGVKGMFTVTSQ